MRSFSFRAEISVLHNVRSEICAGYRRVSEILCAFVERGICSNPTRTQG